MVFELICWLTVFAPSTILEVRQYSSIHRLHLSLGTMGLGRQYALFNISLYLTKTQ